MNQDQSRIVMKTADALAMIADAYPELVTDQRWSTRESDERLIGKRH
jgi:hypothetical protein